MEEGKPSNMMDPVDDTMELQQFLRTYNERIVLLNCNNFDQLKRPIMVMFHYNTKMCSEFQMWTDLLYELSSKYKDSVQLAVAQLEDVNLFHFDWQELDILGMDVNLPPYVFAIDPNERQYHLGALITNESVKQFCDHLIEGRLFMSDPIPNYQLDDTNLQTVVARNFKEFVEENAKDVCITFHTNYTTLCDSHVHKEVAKYFKNDADKIVFYEVNASTNYIPPEYRIREFPTSIFIPKNDKVNRKRLVHKWWAYHDLTYFISKNLTEESKIFDRKGYRKNRDNYINN